METDWNDETDSANSYRVDGVYLAFHGWEWNSSFLFQTSLKCLFFCTLINIEHPLLLLISSSGTWCAAPLHKRTETCRHTRTRERTHILCTMRGLTTATVAMVTTLHVWIKHYITAKATLSPSESVSVPLSFAFLLHLLCSLLLYQNVQACEEMKMFDKDSTQDGVCTLDLRLLAAAMIVML